MRLERFDRATIDEDATAKTPAAAAADVAVTQDLAESPARGVLADDVGAQPCFSERSTTEELVRVAAEAGADPYKHRKPMLPGGYDGTTPETCAKTLATICQRPSNFASEKKLVNDAVPQQPSSSTVAVATSPAWPIDMMCAE